MNGALPPGVRTFGDRHHPPIVFLHGIRLAGAIWLPHARALSDAFYCIVVDLPGHGALAAQPFDMPHCSALLDEVAKHTEQAPLLVGYSLGGYVAMQYALGDPKRTAALVLTGCSADIVGTRALLWELAVAFTAQFKPQTVQGMLSAFFRLTLPPDIAQLIIPFPFDQRTFALSRRLVCGVPYSDLLRAYGKPVEIVNGQWDVFRADEDRYVQAAHAGLHVLEGSDHVGPLRRPQEFTACVRAFAARVFAG